MTHQQRYRDAWEKYRDPTLTDAERQVLEQEMDSAQNDFTWDEFQDFKKTLPGYLEHWRPWSQGSPRLCLDDQNPAAVEVLPQ